ncbi:hypothetical protein Tco_0933334 [Tanacetum coccineum]
MLRKGSDFSEESIKRAGGKNRLMKAVQSSSHASIVPSLSSFSHVFASPVVCFFVRMELSCFVDEVFNSGFVQVQEVVQQVQSWKHVYASKGVIWFSLPENWFPAQSVGSSNTDVLDSPCLLVLITGTSQSRQHDSDHAGCLDSRKSTSDGIQFLGGDKLDIPRDPNLLAVRKFESSSYHALGAYLRPYNDFLRR